jgi:Ca-activated chloride channel family protein
MVNARMPLNIALVLDHSNSMIVDGKIKRLREAVKNFIDQLAPEDYVSLLMFVDSAEMLAPSQPARDRNKLKRQVDRVTTENVSEHEMRIIMQTTPSGTDAVPALQAALAEAKKARAANRLSRIILLTDGQLMHPDAVVALAQRAGSDGIPIIALGVGTDWNDALMQEIAQESGGIADYIAKPHDILIVFQDALTSLQATVVQNAALTLRVSSGVEIRKVWRVVPLIADLGSQPNIALGDLEKDTGQMLLVEFLLPPRAAGNYRVAQVEVAYDVPTLNIVGERVRADLLVAFSADAARFPINPRVMNIAERVTAFKLQTRALEDARIGNTSAATEKLRSAATILLNQGEADLARTLRLEADNLDRSGQMSAEGAKTIKFKGGKTKRIE